MSGTRRSKGPVGGVRRGAPEVRREGRLALAAETVVMDDEAAEPLPDLLATIEAEIIPRLMLAHRTEAVGPSACVESRPPPNEAEIYEFARIAACHDLGAALAFVETVCRQGLPLESILLELITPAARLLGEQWKEDLRSFTEVSAGLGTLQQVVHVLGPSFAPALPHRGLVVLAVVPGEQHTLGIYLVGEFLRRAGWGVQVSPSVSEQELLSLVSSEHVEVLGISVSNEELLKPLAKLIAGVRSASRNRKVTVMVGGPLDLHDYAVRNGAVVCAGDPREAVRWLELHGKSGGCGS